MLHKRCLELPSHDNINNHRNLLKKNKTTTTEIKILRALPAKTFKKLLL